MRRIIFLTIISLSLSVASFAQGKEDARRPSISIEGPAGIVLPGDIATFTAELSKGAPSNTTYSWTVSAGEIVSGQNTLTLQVRLPNNAKFEGNLTATLEIRGLGKGCPETISETLASSNDRFVPIFVDEYPTVATKKG